VTYLFINLIRLILFTGVPLFFIGFFTNAWLYEYAGIAVALASFPVVLFPFSLAIIVLLKACIFDSWMSAFVWYAVIYWVVYWARSRTMFLPMFYKPWKSEGELAKEKVILDQRYPAFKEELEKEIRGGVG
jgi:hypothetical protein